MERLSQTTRGLDSISDRTPRYLLFAVSVRRRGSYTVGCGGQTILTTGRLMSSAAMNSTISAFGCGDLASGWTGYLLAGISLLDSGIPGQSEVAVPVRPLTCV